ncbi:winged helix-turn-helix domain-containing protein [Halorubrum sp. Atlit-28R]|uniref:helix-turn-helix transcriptional regulator n=1 Tax=Halorubrum sp. Atlit-28R TaxID=2282129 RepID=UPI000EF1E747|nr:winged helix-turn-helix domain-containing protein [Halorubrum sp. Atlit-28R]RLM49649.1 ArsR family transcriptional regulator [Halorubrum sp. Atlit-28R]
MTLHCGDAHDTLLDKRSSYLRALIDQPRPKCDLEDELDGSRSTLDRALRELADANLATYEDGVWKPTHLGRCSFEAREAYLDQIDSLAEAAPLLTELPSGSPVGCEFIIGADVYETDPSMPDAVMQTLLDSVEGGHVILMATPVIVTGFSDEFYGRVSSDEDYSLEVLIPPDVFERSRTTFPTPTDEIPNDENVRLHTAPIPFNFGLWVVDSTEAGIIIFTDRGLRGILLNDTTDALDWAVEQYERLKQDAEPVFL